MITRLFHTSAAAVAACALPLFYMNAIAAEPRLEWTKLPSIPDAAGLGGAYGGTSGNALIVAGGSNFQDKMPWEGGTKSWHKGIYVLDRPDGQWRGGFEMPFCSGYGVSASLPEGLVLAGGSDANGHLTNVLLLTWNAGSIQTKNLPALPLPLAYSCGAALDGSVYVAGGTVTPTATSTEKKFLRLDMQKLARGWEELPSWPGAPRMLATAAVLNGSLFVVGGTDLSAGSGGSPQRTYLKDGYRFTPGKGWDRIADMPNPVVAAPTPAPLAGTHCFLVVGGDDGSLVNFEPRSKHPGFPKRVLSYDATSDRWTVLAEAPASRATLPTAVWQGMQVLMSGESRPGVRSPEVWTFRTTSN